MIALSNDTMDKAEADVLGTGGELLLLLTLLITPLITVTRQRWIAPLRRWYGIMFAATAIADGIIASITTKFAGGVLGRVAGHSFLLSGLVMVGLVIPIVVTANNPAQRWLGRYWKPLQRMTYAIWVPRVPARWVRVRWVSVSWACVPLARLAGAGGLAVVSVVLRGCGPRVTVNAPFRFPRGYPFTAITCHLCASFPACPRDVQSRLEGCAVLGLVGFLVWSGPPGERRITTAMWHRSGQVVIPDLGEFGVCRWVVLCYVRREPGW